MSKIQSHWISKKNRFHGKCKTNVQSVKYLFFLEQASADLHHITVPNRKRSILVNGGQNAHGDGESIYSHQSHGMIFTTLLLKNSKEYSGSLTRRFYSSMSIKRIDSFD